MSVDVHKPNIACQYNLLKYIRNLAMSESNSNTEILMRNYSARSAAQLPLIPSGAPGAQMLSTLVCLRSLLHWDLQYVWNPELCVKKFSSVAYILSLSGIFWRDSVELQHILRNFNILRSKSVMLRLVHKNSWIAVTYLCLFSLSEV